MIGFIKMRCCNCGMLHYYEPDFNVEHFECDNCPSEVGEIE